MGIWYDIKIKFEHRNASISDLLVNAGVAEFAVKDDYGRDNECLKIDIKKISPKIYNELNTKRATYGMPLKEYFYVNYKDEDTKIKNGLRYYSKAGVDESIIRAISSFFKEDIMYIDISNDQYFFENYFYFLKNAELCLRDGTRSEYSIANVNVNCIRELSNGNIKVSVPIGNDDEDKWGSFELTKNNVELVKYTSDYNGEQRIKPPTLLLTGNIFVRFKKYNKLYSAKELCEAYYETKTKYKDEMNAPIRIEGLDKCFFKKISHNKIDNEFYVVRIPCPVAISEDEVISIAIGTHFIKEDTSNSYIVDLGSYGSPTRNVQVVENGHIVKKQMLPRDIKKYYEETLNV